MSDASYALPVIITVTSKSMHYFPPFTHEGLKALRGPWLPGWCCCLVAQLCLTLCDTVDWSTPGFPVLHRLPEFAQTHVHWISGAISPCVIPFSSFSLSHVVLAAKNPPVGAGDVGDSGSLDPRLGRSPAGGHSNLLQNSCLENPLDRRAWWGHRVTKSWTLLKWLSKYAHKVKKMTFSQTARS